jgi:alpha-N-arabinofuranosidase
LVTVLRVQVTVIEPIPQTAPIDVDATSLAGPPIPRTLFGTFLEPINDSTYNGLWAELLQNPSFEAGLWSPAWTADMLRDNPELVQSSRLAIPLPWEPRVSMAVCARGHLQSEARTVSWDLRLT